jgi:inositol-1,3,4-trisphosphate 5/6-kinase/inositol-tetrakisphosphate 1-kinase
MDSKETTATNNSINSTPQLLKVGVHLAEKKWVRFEEQKFRELLLEKGYELIKLNLDEPLEKQGPFAAILHKVSDLMARSLAGDSQAKTRIDNFEKYLSDHPEVALIDKLDGVRLLMDRFSEYQLVSNSDVVKNGKSNIK